MNPISGHWKWKEAVEYGWHPWYMLPNLHEWLTNRANQHTDWLEDHSKYVDIRFDSRTGNFLVRHGTDENLVLMWIED